MRTIRSILSISVGLCVLIGLNSPAFAQKTHKTVKAMKKELPAAVTSAFEKEFPNVKAKGIEKMEKDGTTAYAFGWKEGNIKHDVEFKDDGSVLKNETKESLKWKEIPSAIKKAISAAHPKGKIGEAKKVTADNTVKYEINVKDGAEKLKVFLDESGKILNA